MDGCKDRTQLLLALVLVVPFSSWNCPKMFVFSFFSFFRPDLVSVSSTNEETTAATMDSSDQPPSSSLLGDSSSQPSTFVPSSFSSSADKNSAETDNEESSSSADNDDAEDSPSNSLRTSFLSCVLFLHFWSFCIVVPFV